MTASIWKKINKKRLREQIEHMYPIEKKQKVEECNYMQIKVPNEYVNFHNSYISITLDPDALIPPYKPT